MKLYISDLHLYHENIMKLDARNFADVRQMNQYIVEKWNAKVKGGDQVIVLGDMFWTKNPDEVNYILNRLNGKICLIEGNHDCNWLNRQGVAMDRFEWIKPYASFSDGKNIVVASHYPVFCYNHQYLKNEDGSDRTYMLYGHVHNTHDEVLVNQFVQQTRQTVLKGEKGDRTIPCHMINCFCCFSDYTPLSLEEWKVVDEQRRKNLCLPERQGELQVIRDEM